MPIAAAMDAVSANDSGVRPIETNQSTLLTRPTSARGTRRCSSVAHTTKPTAMPMPNSKPSAAEAQGEGGGVGDEAAAGSQAGDERAAGGRAGDPDRDAARRDDEAVDLLEPVGSDDVGQQRGRGRVEERVGGAVHARDRHQ